MVISPVVNLDNAKDRSSAGRGTGWDGDGDSTLQGFCDSRRAGRLAYNPQSVSTTVKAAPCAARARLIPLPYLLHSSTVSSQNVVLCNNTKGHQC